MWIWAPYPPQQINSSPLAAQDRRWRGGTAGCPPGDTGTTGGHGDHQGTRGPLGDTDPQCHTEVMLLPPGHGGAGKGTLEAKVCHGGAVGSVPGVPSSFPIPLLVPSPTGELQQRPKELASAWHCLRGDFGAVLQRWVRVGAEGTVTAPSPGHSPRFPLSHPGTVLSVSGWRRSAPAAPSHTLSLSIPAEPSQNSGLQSCRAPFPTPGAPIWLLTGPRPHRQKTKPGGEAGK